MEVIGEKRSYNFETLNYLAHFYLAWPDEPLMFGNYIGDGVKGSALDRFPPAIQRGIFFHRFIDSFTDRHPEVLEAKRMFYPTQGKFSGVVVDVLFDHLLAMQWPHHHKEPLAGFAVHCYDLIDRHTSLLPERSAQFFQYMRSNNLLEGYGTERGLVRVFRGMDSRTRFDSRMSTALDDLTSKRVDLQQRFDRFFPELVTQCATWKEEHGIR